MCVSLIHTVDCGGGWECCGGCVYLLTKSPGAESDSGAPKIDPILPRLSAHACVCLCLPAEPVGRRESWTAVVNNVTSFGRSAGEIPVGKVMDKHSPLSQPPTRNLTSSCSHVAAVRCHQ